jgi:hypothetical protein
MNHHPLTGEGQGADRQAGHVVEPHTNHLVSTAISANRAVDSLSVPTQPSSLPSPDPETTADAGAQITARTGRLMLDELRSELSARDLLIAQSLADFRYLTTRQIEALHFSDHATPLTGARKARLVLERLTRHRVIVRLERRVGGLRAGSSSYVYSLGPVGFRLLTTDGSRLRPREPSRSFLDHTLAVAQLAIDLLTTSGTTSVVTEPHCWRTFSSGVFGATDTLKPDLFVVTTDDEYEYRWFVEVDLGTESGTAIRKKAEVYLSYLKSGVEHEDHELFPRVLFVAPDDRRARFLRGALTHLKHAPSELFLVTEIANALRVLKGGTP